MTDTLPISAIRVGERRREEMGDLDALALSIGNWGLLHPIVIDDERNLVAGHRRLEACKLLEWPDVPVRSLGDLSETERREIELEENLQRKDLTPYERSRTMVELIEAAAELSVHDEPKLGPLNGGRPAESSSQRAIEKRTGIDRTTAARAETHVATADAYPFMQSPAWKQSYVLAAREELEKLPPEERPKAAALVSEPGIPPKERAIPILENLVAMPAEQRQRIFTLAESEVESDRTLALTEAASLPPMPDSRLSDLQAALRLLRRNCGRVADGWDTRIRECAVSLAALVDEFTKEGSPRP